jgi:hypothetical protein
MPRSSAASSLARVTGTRLADALVDARRLTVSTRDGAISARTSGLVDLVARATGSALADAVAITARRAATAGRPQTAANSYLLFCRQKGETPWPVCLVTLRAWVLWRLATVSPRTGDVYKASGLKQIVAALKRYAFARGNWALTAADEALAARDRALLPRHVPARVRSTALLKHADLLALLDVLARSPPSGEVRLARALLAACVCFQARWSELRQRRLSDLTLEPAGAVLSVVLGKVRTGPTVAPILLFAPHLTGELADLCFVSAYRDLLQFHVDGYTPAWLLGDHPAASRPLFGRLTGSGSSAKMSLTPLDVDGLRDSLTPFLHAAHLPLSAWDAHFGRPSGGSLFEVELGLPESLVTLMAGRGVNGTVYRTSYRNIRSDASAFAKYCSRSIRAVVPRDPRLPSVETDCCV